MTASARITLPPVLAASFLLAAFFFAPDARADRPSMTDIERMFLEGRYEKVVSQTGRLVETGAFKRDELYYLRALSLLKLQRFAEAQQDFEYILVKFPSSKKAFDAAVGLADSRFLGGDVDKAVKGYQDVIERYPDNNSIAGVYYKLGNCLKERGANERAKGCFDRIRSLAPLSFEARMITAFSARTVPRRENAAYFSVQVGCFKNKRNAGNMISKLSRKGYDAFLELPSTPHDRLHRVKVGHLVSKEGAEMLASRLRQDGYKTKICPKSSRADE